MSGRGYFVSDLHLYARRSQAPQHLEAISAAAASAGIFVMGGDIFDFRWTTLPTIERTAQEAAGWLAQLASESPDCQFHFLLGNHDHNQLFINRLKDLAARRANFSWHPFFLRLGESLFMHGDAADRKDPARLLKARTKVLHEPMKPRLLHGLYDLAVAMQVHRLAGWINYPPRRVARRILTYLERIGQGPQTGTRNVYFGHTHCSMSGYKYGGVTFHNGGAPISGLDFRIVEIVG